jgi:hypothetical protein
MKHWIYDEAERVAARNEILNFLRHNGEARTVDITGALPRFRDEPLIIALNFLRDLEKAGKVASERPFYGDTSKHPPKYCTWRLIERISGNEAH